MAITTTTLNGTDSVASSRITINDNFNTIKSALNDVLSIIDIATGKINNSIYGSNNDIETEDLIVNGSVGGGISVLSGNVTVSTGSITINASHLQIGSGTNSVKIEKRTNQLPVGNIPSFNFSGSGATGGTGTSGYMSIPRVTTGTLNDIQQPSIGSIAFNTSTGKLVVCTDSGATGTWTAVH